jgi:hypothetical protein
VLGNVPERSWKGDAKLDGSKDVFAEIRSATSKS